MRSQFVTASPEKRNKGHLPYAFTEHGVTMLASVLRSDKAVKMSIGDRLQKVILLRRRFPVQRLQTPDDRRITCSKAERVLVEHTAHGLI